MASGREIAERTVRGELVTKNAFISYSWDSDSHKEWVHTVAKRLRADGVNVMLDRWETVPGDQLPAFMERAIRENEFVVIIFTPRYKTRSDAREGGVGYEGDVMTAEVMTTQNHRKFIPVLRSGAKDQSCPSWLSGKYYINLSGDPYSERNYADLVRTLLGIRESAPPLGQPLQTIGKDQVARSTTAGAVSEEFEEIKITRVIVEEITEPRNDGTRGSALYTIPFALSRRPPSQWAQRFIENWNNPPRFSSMHRPGIARISGSTISLNGTMIEEVEKYHRDTLLLAVGKTNQEYREWKRQREQRQARERELSEKHRRRVDEGAKRIKFDE